MVLRMDSFDNITQRRQIVRRSIRFNESEFDLDLSYQSLPGNLENGLDFTDVKLKLENTLSELLVAHKEIEDLNSENGRLKKELADSVTKIKLLKLIGLGPREGTHRDGKLQLKFYSPQLRHKHRFYGTSRSAITSPYNYKLIMSPNHENQLTKTTSENTILRSAGFEVNIDREKTPLPLVEDLKLVHQGPIEPTPILCVGSENIANYTSENQKLAEQRVVEEYDLASFFEGALQQPPFNSTIIMKKPTADMGVFSDTKKIADSESIKLDLRKRVLIVADQSGLEISCILQGLLGNDFRVMSFIKSNACAKHVIESCNVMCKDFSKLDFVIMLTGSFDSNPLELQSMLYSCLCRLAHTNVLIGEIYHNRFLNVHKLNETLRLICSNFSYVNLIELDKLTTSYQRNVYLFDKLFICKHILRYILRIGYRYAYVNYCKAKVQCTYMANGTKNVSTQTESDSCGLSGVSRVASISTQTEDLPEVNNLFFRDQ